MGSCRRVGGDVLENRTAVGQSRPSRIQMYGKKVAIGRSQLSQPPAPHVFVRIQEAPSVSPIWFPLSLSQSRFSFPPATFFIFLHSLAYLVPSLQISLQGTRYKGSLLRYATESRSTEAASGLSRGPIPPPFDHQLKKSE